MSKLFLSMMGTLDGFTAGQDGDLSWTATDDREFERHMAGVLASIDAMVYSHAAYEYLGRYWPSAGTDPQSTDEQRELARLIDTICKIVVSRSEVGLDWGPARWICRDLPEAVTAMKRDATKAIALFAGANAARTFMDHGLIDEYQLIVFPVTLEGGQRLFADSMSRRRFQLLDLARFDRSGAVMQRYQAA